MLRAEGWREVRLDLHPGVEPDAVGSATDMREIFADATFDAVWSSHKIEHLFEHEVALALGEFRRVLKPDGSAAIIDVGHEGVDTDVVRPDAGAALTLSGGLTLRAGDEVVTYVSRDLDPLRGYHVFMRSLARIMRDRPRAHAVIVGGDRVSYGPAPPRGATGKQVTLDRHGPDLPLDRVHFLGRVDYTTFLKVLQVSAVHMYLIYPFVLSWSLPKAMAAGCIVVGSSTGPVTEVLDGSNGHLVDFFDLRPLSERVVAGLAGPEGERGRRSMARETMRSRFGRGRCIERLWGLVGGGSDTWLSAT